MSKPKTNLMDCAVTRIAFITLFCSVLTYQATIDNCGSALIEAVGIVALLVACTVFVGWLAMAIYLLLAQKSMPLMPPMASRIVENINFALFAYWIVARLWHEAVAVWVIPLLWIVWLTALMITVLLKK